MGRRGRGRTGIYIPTDEGASPPTSLGILGNTPLDKEERRSPLERMEGASYCITLPLEE